MRSCRRYGPQDEREKSKRVHDSRYVQVSHDEDGMFLLCRFHHRLVHEEGFELRRLPAGDVEFRRPDGRLLPEAPAPPREPIDAFEALLARLEDGAIVVDPYTGTPSWDGSRPDLGLAVETHLAMASRGRGLREPDPPIPQAAQPWRAARTSSGERVPFRDAIWHPEFQPDWDED